jgi:hypothetical protein
MKNPFGPRIWKALVGADDVPGLDSAFSDLRMSQVERSLAANWRLTSPKAEQAFLAGRRAVPVAKEVSAFHRGVRGTEADEEDLRESLRLNQHALPSPTTAHWPSSITYIMSC